MVLAAALFKEWFYADDVPDARVLEEMVTLLLHGLSGRRVAEPYALEDDPSAGRVQLSGAPPATLLRGGSDWIDVHGNEVVTLSWSNGRLSIEYRPRETS